VRHTVGHGLGAAPAMIIVKNRDASADAWQVYIMLDYRGTDKVIFSTQQRASMRLPLVTAPIQLTVFKFGNSGSI
jgi:hypothetical protein